MIALSKKKKIIVAVLLVICVAVAGLELRDTVSSYTDAYPQSDINGFIAWGAGGATDTVSRTLSVYAARELGVNIVLQNKPGATGAIATEFVKNQKNDGYSLLFNAENPPLYKVMNISNVDYDDFYPVILISQQTPVLVVKSDSDLNSIKDVIDAAQAKPGTVKLATTGIGGLPANVAAMLEGTSHVTFNQIPFDGDSAALTAIMGGHADVSVINYSVAMDYAAEGSVKIICVLANERLASAQDVETISEVYPEYAKYFPWGAFVGVYIRDDCPDRVKETLTAAFRKAWENPEFQEYLETNHILPLGYSGEEARAYIGKWQQVTTWLLDDAGVTEYSPAKYGILRLE